MNSISHSPAPEIIVTGDGSHTLYLPEINEHYHSHFGALTESIHIFINTGLKYCTCEHVRILEVGFGTGLNALLTALYAEENKRHITYCTLEKYPLTEKIIESLNYGSVICPGGTRLFNEIHHAAWEEKVQINEFFTLEKRNTDIITDPLTGDYDLIYFDAFGPDKQPEIWSSEVFSKISDVSSPGTVFVTYSAKGMLKRMLRSKGFEVNLLPGPPGKRCITRAVKKCQSEN